jgi:hypothetical protein
MKKIKRRLKGFIRLGIVISIAWVIGVISFIAIKYDVTNKNFVRAVEETKNSRFQFGGRESYLIECSVIDDKSVCSIKITNTLVVLLAPIAVVWIVVPLIVWSALWIRAGFKDNST